MLPSESGEGDPPGSEAGLDLGFPLTAPRRELERPMQLLRCGAYLFDAICRPQETQSKNAVPSTFTLVGVLEPVPADPFAVADVLCSPEEEGVSDLEVADAPTPDWEAPADDPDT